MNLENEIWKVIEDFPEYQINNFGSIKSLKFGKERILKQGKNTKGYYQVILNKNKRHYTKRVHTLVYENFYNEKLNENECIHHIDKNKENNNWKNLKKIIKYDHDIFHNPKGKYNINFGKKRPNEIIEKIKNGNTGKHVGQKNSNVKLTENNIIEIKKLLKLGFKNIEISRKLNINKRTISHIKVGDRWSHITIDELENINE